MDERVNHKSRIVILNPVQIKTLQSNAKPGHNIIPPFGTGNYARRVDLGED